MHFCIAQVAAWQQELVADYSGSAPAEGEGSAGGVPNPPLGHLPGGARPPAPPHLTRWGVSSEQDAEWQALLTAQQVGAPTWSPPSALRITWAQLPGCTAYKLVSY